MALDLTDKTSNVNTLTNHSATEYTTDFSSGISREAVKVVSASSQYLDASHIAAYNVTNLSLECWIKITSISANGWLIAKDDAILGRAFSFGYTSLGKLDLQINGVATNTKGTTTLPIGIWTHVGLTWDDTGQTAIYYINGLSDGSSALGSTQHIASTTALLNIGRRSFTTSEGYCDSVIDEVRFWNTTRTANNILSNKNQHLYGSESGLVAYYPFENLGRIISGVRAIASARSVTTTRTIASGRTIAV